MNNPTTMVKVTYPTRAALKVLKQQLGVSTIDDAIIHLLSNQEDSSNIIHIDCKEFGSYNIDAEKTIQSVNQYIAKFGDVDILAHEGYIHFSEGGGDTDYSLNMSEAVELLRSIAIDNSAVDKLSDLYDSGETNGDSFFIAAIIMRILSKDVVGGGHCSEDVNMGMIVDIDNDGSIYAATMHFRQEVKPSEIAITNIEKDS